MQVAEATSRQGSRGQTSRETVAEMHVTRVRSRKREVLEVIEERHRSGTAPFGDVLELLDFMEGKGSDLEDIDIGVAVARLVCERQLRYALDGIRLIDQ